MHPVGPRPSGVYWLRRVIFIVVLIAVLVGVIFIVAGRTKGGTAGGAADQAAVSESARPTLTGVLASDATAAGSEEDGFLPAPSPPATWSAASTTTPKPATSKSTVATSATPTPTSAKPTPTSAKPTPTSATPTPTSAKPPPSAAATAAKPAVTTEAKPAVTTPAKPAVTAPAKPAVTTPAKPATTPATLQPTTKPAPPKSTAPPAPSTDAQGRLLCSDAILQLVATTGAPSYVTGDRPILGVAVTNSGTTPCVRDLSGPLQVFTVYTAAGARVWSTADCFPGEGTDIRTLPARTTVHYNIKWSGTTSAPGCTGARVQVPAGRYQVRVTVGSLRAAPADFIIS